MILGVTFEHIQMNKKKKKKGPGTLSLNYKAF